MLPFSCLSCLLTLWIDWLVGQSLGPHLSGRLQAFL